MTNYSIEYEFCIKLILIGSTNTGKSCICNKLIEEKYNDEYPNTIGVDFFVKKININNKNHILQIWDTAGQERFRSITRSYYNGSHAILLVFDLTNYSTFFDLNYWISEIYDKKNKNVPIFLIGNKCDLVNNICVSESKINEFIASNKIMKYFKISAKLDNHDLEKTFENILKITIRKMKKKIYKSCIIKEIIPNNSETDISEYFLKNKYCCYK